MRVRIPGLARRSAVIAAALASLTAASAPVAHAAPTPCQLSLPPTAFVEITGTVGDVVVDSACQFVYATNTDHNSVEVIALETGTSSPRYRWIEAGWSGHFARRPGPVHGEFRGQQHLRRRSRAACGAAQDHRSGRLQQRHAGTGSPSRRTVWRCSAPPLPALALALISTNWCWPPMRSVCGPISGSAARRQN